MQQQSSISRFLACVLGVAFLIPVVAATGEDPATPSERLSKHLGPEILARLKSVERVEAFRVGSGDATKTAPEETVANRVIQSKGTAMPADFNQKLVAALLADSTYFSQDSKGCVVGVGFRLWCQDGSSLDVSYCLKKANVWMTVRDKEGKAIKWRDMKGFREDETNPLRSLATEAFPAAEDIQLLIK